MTRAGRWLRRLLWVVGGLVAIVLLAAASGLIWMHRAMVKSLPEIDGTAHIPGLSAPVTVRRDSHGVPHIEATNLDDLLLAQGYVTAQDRLWQMDMLRRNAAGELAEILGPSLVDHDKAQRVFQFRNVSLRIYHSLPENERRRYEQYAKGVNLFVEQHSHSLPSEFRFLHYRPRPWEGPDALLILTSMVETLDTHFDAKLSKERITAELHDPKLAADLFPTGSWRDQPPTAAVADMTQPHPAGKPSDDEDDDKAMTQVHPAAGKFEDARALRQLLGLTACEGCAAGSNEWVISGKHTASGKPLLSNDMHLDLSVPNIWYMADLKMPGMHVTGVSLPGTPLITAGHNDHVAWGYTALYADVQDLYVEKLDGKGNDAGPHGEWIPLAHTPEVIHVRFGKDVKLDVQLTAHGPLLNPLFKREKRAIALHSTLYDPALASVPLYEMNTAANWQQFSSALSAWCWPTLSLVYSDDAGHIAYHAIGKVPLRPAGLMGVPIQDNQHEWQGYIPFDEMPFSFDPPSGLLATANSRVTPNDTKFPLTLEWPEPYRAERIYMDLRGRDGLTRDDMLATETDIYSEVDQELAHRFAYAIDQTSAQTAQAEKTAPQSGRTSPAAKSPAAVPVDARLKQAADLLRSWDGRMSVDSPAASIIYRTRQAFRRLVLEPKLGSDWDAYEWAESNFAMEEIIMHGSSSTSPSPWLPANYKDWDALLTEAVRRGLELGKAPADLAHWNYGSWHVIDLEHPLYQLLPIAKGWSGTGEQPLSGDGTTVKQVGRAFGPSQRFTMDWSAPDASTEDIVLGESGNPASPWYRDQWAAWYGGTTFALPFSPDAIAGQTTHTLRLVP
ncbi:MAG TPA: penicillin acylase family protein [Acidobacteriaceae bacterium]|nr:penicillin acylase family protein [Acidobacteriaceae bacterium]